MSKSSSNHDNNYKMDYKFAINAKTHMKQPSISHQKFDRSKLKRGWVLLTYDGIFDTPTETERESIDKDSFEFRANKQMNEIVYRYLSRKRKELEFEGYDENEIDNIIENIIRPILDADEDNLSDEEDYYSNSDDDGYY